MAGPVNDIKEDQPTIINNYTDQWGLGKIAQAVFSPETVIGVICLTALITGKFSCSCRSGEGPAIKIGQNADKGTTDMHSKSGAQKFAMVVAPHGRGMTQFTP